MLSDVFLEGELCCLCYSKLTQDITEIIDINL